MVFRRRFYSNPSLEEPVELEIPDVPEVSVPNVPEVPVPEVPVPESLDVEVLPKAPKRPSKAKKMPVAE